MEHLIAEAKNLINQLDSILYSYYENHSALGEIPRPGTGKQRMRIKRIKSKAQRRLLRRMAQAGLFTPVRGAMWIINDRDSSWF